MSISKRLRLLIELVSIGYVTADIGTDHGYVPISLLRDEKVPYAIGIDVSRGSLEKALFNAVRAGVEVKPNAFVDQALKTMPPEVGERLEMIRAEGSENADERTEEFFSENSSDAGENVTKIIPTRVRKSSGVLELRLSDGLSALAPFEADSIVISGMGGILMTKIMEADKEVALSAKELILSPHRDVDLVRAFLKDNGFEITFDEEVPDKKKVYHILKAVR